MGLSICGKSQKTDSLFHINGNILLGEIKKMDFGRITFKMDGMGTILVDIEKINTIKSSKFFEIITSHGRRLYGNIDSCSTPGLITLNSGYDSNNFHLYQIVEIFPIKSTFFLRTSGGISLGFNYTKGSNIGRFNIDWNLKYRNKGTELSLTASNIQTFTPNDTINTSSKFDYNLNLQRKLPGIWSWTSTVGISQNTELGLDLRLKAVLGVLGDVLHTNNQRLYAVVGAAPNYEVASENTDNTTNIEALFSINYLIFNYGFPELKLTTKLDLSPSLTTKNRLRADYNLDAKIEILNNFYVGGTFYYSFDSKPASESASTEDFGFTTTVGYSFN
ncbi:MAG: DUF481 domain-containing protein [Salibacteraceae bacterium]